MTARLRSQVDVTTETLAVDDEGHPTYSTGYQRKVLIDVSQVVTAVDSRGQEWFLTRVSLVFQRPTYLRVVLRGRVVKADGTPGKDVREIHRMPESEMNEAWQKVVVDALVEYTPLWFDDDHWPDWAREYVKKHADAV